MKQLFILSHDLARQRAIRAVQEAPAGFRITVAEPRKTRDQEERYHAMIGDIAAQYTHAGRQWDAENMKRLLVAAFREDTKDDADFAEAWREFGDLEIVPGIRGGFTMLGVQTRRFPKKLASGFIEWLYAFGAENDVQWSEPRAKVAA